MTLQFKVIVDHPSVLNAVKDQSKITVSQFFAATGGKLKSTINGPTLGLKYDRITKGMSKSEINKVEVVNATDKTNSAIGIVNGSFSLPKNVEPTNIYYSANTSSFLDNATGNTRNGSFSLTSFVCLLYTSPSPRDRG